ncbi:agmatine/peptidylarginine deiminase [Paenarthrobacter sp. 4246]
MDGKALRIPDAYPGRRVIGVDTRELFARGGGIHRNTQQQPSAI